MGSDGGGWRQVRRGPVHLRARAAAVGEAVLTTRGVEQARDGMWLLEAPGGEHFLTGGEVVARYGPARAPEASPFGWTDFEIPAATAEARPADAGEEVVTPAGTQRARAGEWLVRGPSGTFLFSDASFRALYQEL